MNFIPGNLTRLVRPLLLLLVLTLASASFAAVFISVTVAPPPLPVYVQPPCPEPGYIWIPGYWAWGPYGYYWVPGYWALAPEPGLYWTPAWWGWDDGYGAFIWHAGYWGPRVGFYGGINYGFGYFGVGFVGGEWRGRDFYYNRSVVRVNETRITNVYVNRTVIVNNYRESHVSFNGPGGVQRQANQFEQAAVRERRFDATPLQIRHRDQAERNPQMLARNNGGRPAVAATVRPADFSRRSVVPARATGGRVDPAIVRATPKTMPKPTPGLERQGRVPLGATGGVAARGATSTGPAGRAPEAGGRPMAPSREPEAGGSKGFGERPGRAERPESSPRMESRPTPGRAERPESSPRMESRPELRSREVSPPRNEPRMESRPAPGRAERPESSPRMESRPELRSREVSPPRNEPRMESRPAPRPSHGNAPQQRPQKEEHQQREQSGGGDHEKGGDHGNRWR